MIFLAKLKQKLAALLAISFLDSLLTLTGCSSITSSSIDFTVPGSNGIAFAPGSKIKVVTSGNQQIGDHVKRMLERDFQIIAAQNVKNAVELAQQNGVDAQKAKARAEAGQILISDVNPDYWLFVNIHNEYRKDSSADAEMNRFVVRRKVENETGGKEVVQLTSPVKTGSICTVANIMLYSVHGFVPVHSFTLSAFDSSFAKGELKEESAYFISFSKEIVKHIKNGFLLTEQKQVVLIPKTANFQLVDALNTKNKKKIRDLGKQLNLSNLADFLEEMSSLEQKHEPGQFSDKMLSDKMKNQYLLIVDYETDHVDTRSLRLVHRCYLSILKNTLDDGLAEACADSLARVEKKLELLDSLKL